MLHLLEVDSVDSSKGAVHVGAQEDWDALGAHESGHARHNTGQGDLFSIEIN